MLKLFRNRRIAGALIGVGAIIFLCAGCSDCPKGQHEVVEGYTTRLDPEMVGKVMTMIPQTVPIYACVKN